MVLRTTVSLSAPPLTVLGRRQAAPAVAASHKARPGPLAAHAGRHNSLKPHARDGSLATATTQALSWCGGPAVLRLSAAAMLAPTVSAAARSGSLLRCA